jgi:hypothetical protein
VTEIRLFGVLVPLTLAVFGLYLALSCLKERYLDRKKERQT